MKQRNRRYGWRCAWGALQLVLALALAAAGAAARGAELARELGDEGDHAGAALEYRRLAVSESDAGRRAGWYWMAGYEYWRAGQPQRAESMVARAEGDDAALVTPSLLLRAETARATGHEEEAAFYYETLGAAAVGDAGQAYARRAWLALRLEQGDLAAARTVLDAWSDAPAEASAAVDRYAAGRDKHPKLGGVLGLVPGLGYAYAGEYASGLRSLILNAIFMYGMYQTADDNQWGAFAAITFFEFTWYTGSIYGGIDASERYNRRRAEAAAATVRGGAMWQPDAAAVPSISLRFSF